MTQGRSSIGWAVGISLVARLAIFNPCEYSRYQDGDCLTPDVESFISSEEPYKRIDPECHYQEILGEKCYRKLQDLRARIAAVLRKHRIEVLEKAVLDLPLPRFKAAEEVFLQKPLRVRDAFFFRGI